MANSNGKKGSEEHANMVKELMEQIHETVDQETGKTIIAKTEYPIATPKGTKKERFLDVAGVIDSAENPFSEDLVYLAQVVRTDKNGEPVAREKEAIEDIENVTQKHVNFYDYKTKTKIR